jgi:hypothetical protein
MSRKWLVRGVVGLIVVAVVFVGAIFAGALYINRSAERHATEFCEAIPVGSAISVAIAEAARRKVLWSTGRTYAFYFSGLFFDKGVCEVSVSDGGKVVSKSARMEFD